jgi:arginyl-tRNA synthetase
MLTKKLTALLQNAFEEAGYDKKYGEVVVSGRPDLCQFQCNGAMPAAKEYKKAPFMISDEVIEKLHANKESKEYISEAVTIRPGFINIKLTDERIAKNVELIGNDPRLGVDLTDTPAKIVIDFGGPNIAKPLHVGHLRTAIIGESLKRLLRFLGNDVIGDIHLGDWGLQMGMVISEIKRMQPDLPYFDADFVGEYPTTPPFTLADLDEIYPRVSAKSKEDETVYEESKEATFQLQNRNKGYLSLWQHIVDVSVADIKQNYKRLNVEFDLWYGESHADPYIDDAIQILKDKDVLYKSDGALVVDVARATDKKEIPPIILFKSDGSVIYGTTDLATIYQRVKDFNPDNILYVVDSRQAGHFTQVFRCAQDHGIAPAELKLEHIGFGTMNGKDGKPFKTRAGGILRLEELIQMVEDNAKAKIESNLVEKGIEPLSVDVDEISKIVGLATLKYADLSNYRLKDYMFDLDKFSSFEGKTGPYILYSTVRIKNIIRKLEEVNFEKGPLLPPASQVERDIMLKIDTFGQVLQMAGRDRTPNIICEYVYELATLVSSFYHVHHIINEENIERKKSWYTLLSVTLDVLSKGLDILGIIVPEKM